MGVNPECTFLAQICALGPFPAHRGWLVNPGVYKGGSGHAKTGPALAEPRGRARLSAGSGLLLDRGDEMFRRGGAFQVRVWLSRSWQQSTVPHAPAPTLSHGFNGTKPHRRQSGGGRILIPHGRRRKPSRPLWHKPAPAPRRCRNFQRIPKSRATTRGTDAPRCDSGAPKAPPRRAPTPVVSGASLRRRAPQCQDPAPYSGRCCRGPIVRCAALGQRGTGTAAV
jgi:hypothetical protein